MQREGMVVLREDHGLSANRLEILNSNGIELVGLELGSKGDNVVGLLKQRQGESELRERKKKKKLRKSFTGAKAHFEPTMTPPR